MNQSLALIAGASALAVIAGYLLLAPAEPPRDSVATITASPPPESRSSAGPGTSDPTHGNPGGASYWPDPGRDGAGKVPLPPPMASAARSARPAVSLWQPFRGDADTTVDGVPATRVRADPATLDGLHVGQRLTLEIPPLQQPVRARITSTHNQLDRVQVFRGPVTDGDASDNVIITRGDEATYVVVSTRNGVFSTVIDNHSGEATLTDERDINARIHPANDAVPVPGIEQEPPASQ